MVRTLLGSTALLSIVLATPALAAEKQSTPALQTPQLKISGQSSFNSHFFHNRVKNAPGVINPAQNDPTNFRNQRYGRGQLFTVDNSRIKFNIDGKLDTGMDYGLVIVLDGAPNKTKNLRENYLFFGGSWGQVYLGDTYGVQSIMAFGGFDQWGGTGFIDGSIFDRVVNYTTGTLHSVDLVGDTNRDTKFTYMSPRWNGLQFGMTYTPRTEHRGEEKINSKTSTDNPKAPFSTDNIANGINFIHKFENGFEVALSATSIFGKAHKEYSRAPLARKHVASYALGGTFSYSNIGFSVEYGSNGKSQEYKGQGRSNAGKFVDFGLSYTYGPTKFSTGYYYGWRDAAGANAPGNMNTILTDFRKQKSKTNAFSTAVDHKLAPGLGVYFEYAYFRMRNPAAVAEANRNAANFGRNPGAVGAVPNNRASAFIVGSRLVF